MGKFSGKTALVTGGSSGIGLELAGLLAAEGAALVLVASDAAKLERARASLEVPGGPKVHAIARDLAQPDAPAEIHAEVARLGLPVDILVNSAGFGMRVEFAHADLGKTLRMIDVNVKALVALTHFFLPRMIAGGWGRVMNVASTAGFQAIPVEACYAASKSFVLLFSEALHDELEGTGVSVTCLCPGATDTAFFRGGDIAASKAITAVMMDSRSVARAGLSALERGRPLVVAGLRNASLVFLERLFPRRWVLKMARRVVE
ncbi:MAG TPA: SDR family NAD(P)-dependent oxidoreductase [Candidatus Eisenbacteria bacterium]|nr:SDR family NAD(P)-dependent oxidoreductase [Candidatus Eisenbacteria bacterium]